MLGTTGAFAFCDSTYFANAQKHHCNNFAVRLPAKQFINNNKTVAINLQ